MENDTIYGLFFQGKPIHEVVFWKVDRLGKLRKKTMPKKLYTKLGYAWNGVRNLPDYVDKSQITIMEYAAVKEHQRR